MLGDLSINASFKKKTLILQPIVQVWKSLGDIGKTYDIDESIDRTMFVSMIEYNHYIDCVGIK